MARAMNIAIISLGTTRPFHETFSLRLLTRPSRLLTGKFNSIAPVIKE